MQRVHYFLFAVLSTFIFTGPSIAQDPADVAKTMLSLGFRVTQTAMLDPTASESDQFGMLTKRRYSIKSLRPVPGERDLFYRYTVDVEAYKDHVHAQSRVDHIDSDPPGPDTKLRPESALREAFRRANLVFVISTDVYKFVVEKSLRGFREALQQAIPDIGDHRSSSYMPCGPLLTSTVVGRCRSVADAKKRYFSYLLTFDVEKTLAGEFKGNTITFEAIPGRVRRGTAEARLINALKIMRDDDGFRCDSSSAMRLTLNQEYGDGGVVTLTSLLHFEPASGHRGSADRQSKPTTVRDYLLLLPEKYFVFESCVPDEDPECREAKADYLKRFVEVEDIPNGYIKGSCDGAQKCMEMAIFKKPDGSHIVGLGVFHEGLKEYFFLDYRNGMWTDVSTTLVPEFSKRNYYDLPRYGTAIRVSAGEVVAAGDGWEQTRKGRPLYNLEWKDGRFVIRRR